MRQIKSLLAGLLLGAFFIASAHAQGQLSSGQIWGNDTASPGLAKPSTIDSILAQVGGLSATRLTFTQNGTGAVSKTFDAFYRDKIFYPEMYGAVSSPLGTAAASIADSTLAIQRAINEAAAIGGGTVQLGPGAYAITALTISTNNIFIKGSGLNATTLVHKLSAPASGLIFSAGASVLSNTGVMDLTIGSNDTVFNKIAINVSDVSYFTVRNVNVAHYPVDGTLYRASGGTGTALFIQGREHGVVENFQAYAEQPLRITVNPNSTLSMDSWVFRNLVLVSQLSTATYHDITIDANVNIYNTAFTGHQNWIGGVDGLHWVDTTSSTASLGLNISGIKSEQSGVSGASGYAVNIQHNIALDALKIDGIIGGDRALIKLRKVNNTSISNCYFDPVSGTGTNTVGLDLDSTDLLVNVRSCFWTNVGGRATTASISGLNTAQADAIISGSSPAIPSNVTYTASTSPKLFNTIFPNSIIGVTTNSNAPAGSVGEFVTSTVVQGSAVALTTNTPANITSISLTAGDWDVSGNAIFTNGGTTNFTVWAGSFSATSATLDATPGRLTGNIIAAGNVPGASQLNLAMPTARFSLASTTTIFFVSQATFTVSTAGAYGIIRARRVR
jgi:hypothetical protein